MLHPSPERERDYERGEPMRECTNCDGRGDDNGTECESCYGIGLVPVAKHGDHDE
jgi:DnaJ-class molecular chaperone